MEVGYVCNNQKCGDWGSPKYFEYEEEISKECPRCKENRAVLIEGEAKKKTGEKISAPAVKLDNGKYYG